MDDDDESNDDDGDGMSDSDDDVTHHLFPPPPVCFSRFDGLGFGVAGATANVCCGKQKGLLVSLSPPLLVFVLFCFVLFCLVGLCSQAPPVGSKR